MISHHCRTLLGVYSFRQRAAFAGKGLLWLGAAVLFLLFAGRIGEKIGQFCEQYGESLVRALCGFMALFLLFASVMEYRHIVTVSCPDNDFSFYYSCGFSRRLYRVLRLLRAVPVGSVSLELSCLLCFPLIGTGGGKAFFAAGWLVLLAVCCVVSDRSGKRSGRTGLTDMIRTGLLRKGRTGALLAFSFSGAGKGILFLLLAGLGILLGTQTPWSLLSCWLPAWLSYYFVIFTVEDYGKHAGFHQLLPCTFRRLVRDDLKVSAFFCGAVLLAAGSAFALAHGLSAEAAAVPVLMWLYALSNHAALYFLLEPMLPAEKLTDTFAPVLVLIAVLQVIPGFSLLLMVLLWRRRRKTLNQSVPWGRKAC
ncbi:MAG: hypothetical protein J5841_02315 [Clostridia bacterium]|nr:hypothetical protein [Clostridia bacterium]